MSAPDSPSEPTDLSVYVYDPGMYYAGGINGTQPDTGDFEFCPITPGHPMRFTTYYQLYQPDTTPTVPGRY